MHEEPHFLANGLCDCDCEACNVWDDDEPRNDRCVCPGCTGCGLPHSESLPDGSNSAEGDSA